jgi:hypothetical protein
MATTTARLPQTKRSTDRIFFPILTLLLLVTVWIGFAPTYYAAGMIHAPLPDALIHVHAALMTGWLALLIAQTGLVSAGRTDLHRKLGLYGFGLALLIVVVAPLAATDSLRRGVTPSPALDSLTFYAVPMFTIAAFALLVAAGYRMRTSPGSHKRLVMLGTIVTIGAAIGRFRWAPFRQSHWAGDGVMLSFVLLVVLYDLFSTRRLQKATLWGGLVVMAVQELAVPLGMTPLWHAFARMMMKLPV